MTFAEAIFFVVAVLLLYRFLRPVRERLEIILLRWFGGQASPGKKRRIIDITDYARRKNPPKPKPEAKPESKPENPQN